MTSNERNELEAEILRLLRARMIDEAAEQIIRGYGPEILAYLANIMNDREGAKEAYSQFAEDMLKGLSTFEPRAMVRTWAYCIARHACARHYRDPYRRLGDRLSTGAQGLLRATSEKFFMNHVDPDEKVARIRTQLSAEDREILTLHIDRGLNWSEIAKVVGITHAAARQRFHRVKEKIRNLLAQQQNG